MFNFLCYELKERRFYVLVKLIRLVFISTNWSNKVLRILKIGYNLPLNLLEIDFPIVLILIFSQIELIKMVHILCFWFKDIKSKIVGSQSQVNLNVFSDFFLLY